VWIINPHPVSLLPAGLLERALLTVLVLVLQQDG
jgi:hypothetical protein